MADVIIYYSISGNTTSFAKRFISDGYEVIPVKQAKGIDRPYVLFTPTYNFGEIPAPVRRFLNEHSDNIQAVVSFGNQNWGAEFAKAGEKVSEYYGVPLLFKVEMRGGDREYAKVKEKLNGGLG